VTTRPGGTPIARAIIVPGFMDRVRYASYSSLEDALTERGVETSLIDLFAGVRIAELGQYNRSMSRDLITLRSAIGDALTNDDRPHAAIGYCYGGNLALQLAATDPRISTVVAIAPTNFFIWASRFNEERAKTFSQRPFSLPGLCGEPPMGPFTIPSTVLDDARGHDVELALPSVTQPSLFVVGANDNFIPPTAVRHLHDLCGSAQKTFLAVAGVGHDYRHDSGQVEAMTRAVVHWLCDDTAVANRPLDVTATSYR
jgi:pimeloyl-ACP methyl ester carboxylesterase